MLGAEEEIVAGIRLQDVSTLRKMRVIKQQMIIVVNVGGQGTMHATVLDTPSSTKQCANIARRGVSYYIIQLTFVGLWIRDIEPPQERLVPFLTKKTTIRCHKFSTQKTRLSRSYK